MGHPVAIPSHLVDSLDEVGTLTLEHIEDAEDAPLLDVLDRFVQDLDHKRMIEPVSLVLDIGSRSIPDDRFECREENQDGEIIPVFQAHARVSDDIPGFYGPQLFISSERAIPGQARSSASCADSLAQGSIASPWQRTNSTRLRASSCEQAMKGGLERVPIEPFDPGTVLLDDRPAISWDFFRSEYLEFV